MKEKICYMLLQKRIQLALYHSKLLLLLQKVIPFKYLDRGLRKTILSHGDKFLTRLKTDKGKRAKRFCRQQRGPNASRGVLESFRRHPLPDLVFGKVLPFTLSVWTVTSIKESNLKEVGTWGTI